MYHKTHNVDLTNRPKDLGYLKKSHWVSVVRGKVLQTFNDWPRHEMRQFTSFPVWISSKPGKILFKLLRGIFRCALELLEIFEYIRLLSESLRKCIQWHVRSPWPDPSNFNDWPRHEMRQFTSFPVWTSSKPGKILFKLLRRIIRCALELLEIFEYIRKNTFNQIIQDSDHLNQSFHHRK